MRNLLLFLALIAYPAGAQVFSATLTAVGSGYTTAPTVTATSGSCTTEPTLIATIGMSPSPVTSVVVTYAGVCTPGGTPPTLGFSGGGGSGATATAVMIQASIAILSVETVANDTSKVPQVGGSSRLYNYECSLVPTAARVQFYSSTYSSASPDRMPGTSQSSQIIWLAISGAASLQPLYNAAFASGILTLYDGSKSYDSSISLATAEAAIVADCAKQQTNLNAWNPWVDYGTFYNGSSWTSLGVN